MARGNARPFRRLRDFAWWVKIGVPAMRLLVLLLSLCAALPLSAADTPPDLAPLRKWLAGQASVRTVQADFTQTRSFHALRDPIASPGRIAFSAPRSFRWELGDPPRTVVLRQGDTFYLIQPQKKRAERRSAADLGREAAGGAMPMMDFPFAKDFDDFNRRFEVLGVSTEGTRCHVEMLPRDPQMRKLLTAARIDFDTDSGHLLSFEFVTRDGSSLRNDFTNVRLNAKIEPGRFDYDFTGYDVVDAKP